MENIEENEGRETGHRPACAACKLQRKKCEPECIFRPYFPAEKEAEFSQVQKVFGIAKVKRLLANVRTDEDRKEVAASVFWEARVWSKDSVHGPYGLFKRLEQELHAARGPTSSMIMPPLPLPSLPPPAGFKMTPEFASARQSSSPQSGHQGGGGLRACSSSDRAIVRPFGDHNQFFHGSRTVNGHEATQQGLGERESGFQSSVDPSHQIIPNQSNELLYNRH